MSGWGKGVGVGVRVQHFLALWCHQDSESGCGEKWERLVVEGDL